jgi:hypothetical protein
MFLDFGIVPIADLQFDLTDFSSAALDVFHRTQFCKIEDADWLVILRLHTGHSQPLDSQQRTFAGD